MNALVGPLIHFVWQGALVTAVLWVALRFAQASRTRYALACAAMFAMAAAPLVTYVQRPATELLFHAAEGGPAPTRFDWMAFVPHVWLTGVMVFSVRLARAAWATQGLRRGASPVENAWPHLVPAAVTIWESAEVTVPAQTGIWRPVILLPLGLLAQMPPAQVEAILAHEMAHIYRRDYLVNLLQVVVETLLFYHPGVWWVSSVMRREREHCADERALALTGDRGALAAALLHLEERRQESFAVAATGGDLKTRVERILTGGSPARGTVLPAVVAVILVLGSATWSLGQTMTSAREAKQLAQAERAFSREVERGRARAQLAQADAQKAEQLAQAAEQQAAEQIERAAEKDRQRKGLDQELAAMKARLEALGKDYRETHSDMEALRAAVDALAQKRSLLADEGAMAAEIEAEIAIRGRRLRREIEALRAAGQLTPELVKVYERAQAELPKLVREMIENEPRELQAQVEQRSRERERRTQQAIRKFSTAGSDGARTSRGRIYIEHGPPDEIETKPGQGEVWRYRSGQAFYFDVEDKVYQRLREP